MATRNFETREGFDFWDRLCKITRYAFLLSKAGNSVQKAEGLGNWIDRDEAMAVVGDAQEEINVLRQDCATMIAELEDLRAKASQGGEAVGIVLTEEQMGIGYDRRIGPVLWFGTPPPGEKLYTHPADQVAEPGASQEIQWLEQWLLFAAEPIGQECCNRPGLECCGSPEPVYRTADEIAAAMNARREELRALLAKSEATANGA